MESIGNKRQNNLLWFFTIYKVFLKHSFYQNEFLLTILIWKKTNPQTIQLLQGPFFLVSTATDNFKCSANMTNLFLLGILEELWKVTSFHNMCLSCFVQKWFLFTLLENVIWYSLSMTDAFIHLIRMSMPTSCLNCFDTNYTNDPYKE